MPRKPPRPCKHPRCPNLTTNKSRFCDEHDALRASMKDRGRPSPSKRGYGREWQRIRRQVLREHGIPKEDWPLYDVDHVPAYNPDVEPDHRKYTLVPRLRPEHSRKTAKHDGGFGNVRGSGV